MRIALLSLPLMLVVTVLAGFYFTGRTLLPVKQMTSAVKKIREEENLSGRIGLEGHGRKDEIYVLAETFDEMLAQVERLFRREKQFTSDVSHELRTPVKMCIRDRPFAALLGAYNAQLGFGLPSIGGKDSMSGTFEDIDVPPTLVSFAVDVAVEKDIITPELKAAGNKLVWLRIPTDEYDVPKYDQVMELYGKFREDVQAVSYTHLRMELLEEVL